MFVGERMTKNPITVKPETSVSEAQFLMRKEKVHRFPVLDKTGRLKGIVTEKDLLYATPSPATTLDVYEMNYLLSKLTVDEVMSAEPLTVTEDTPIEEAARVMADNNVGGLPVLRDALLVGIITESDLFRVFLDLFGSRTKGIRVTLLVSDEKGSLAKLTTAIAGCGGNIISLGTYDDPGATQGVLTMKVTETQAGDLRKAIEPLCQILDLREI